MLYSNQNTSSIFIKKGEKMRHIPLSNTFLLLSLLGLMITIFLTLNNTLDLTWSFLLNFMFILFTIASFISATPDDEDLKLK
jgi:hypothetical protein